jgi:hypothetical protein
MIRYRHTGGALDRITDGSTREPLHGRPGAVKDW